jgi:YHS domain-containing protein
VFPAPAGHGAIGPFDELVQLAVTLIPFVGVGLWSFGRRVNERADRPINQKEIAVVEDVVCGMGVRPGPDAIQSTFEDKTYYFCAPGCKRMFEKNPAQFAAQARVGD